MNPVPPLLFALLLPGAGAANPTGDPPHVGLSARDIFSDYQLPPLPDRAGDALWGSAMHLQVLTRAQQLKLTDHSATDAWKSADGALTRAEAAVYAAPAGEPALFRGTRASELNALIARHASRVIVVQSPELLIDTPVEITGSNLEIDFGATSIRAGKSGPYAVRVEGAKEIRVRGGRWTGSGWAVLVSNAQGVVVTDAHIEAMSGGGIVVTNSEDVVIWENHLSTLGAAPILLHGSTHGSVIAHNEITANLGESNWHAGVVLTDRNADLAADPTSLLAKDNYWVKEQPIVARLNVPHDNLVVWNDIDRNVTSGIYVDGAVRSVIVGNRVEGNAKEGLCLDYGASGNVVAYNLFAANGQRWGKSDADLKQDFVFSFGRLPDGTSAAKVPAVSIDNAAYNQVLFNEIDHNYGGGIKMVRTGLYNVVGMNTLTDNNEGRSERFHFFGVELGSAGADVPSPDLDFTPSRGNMIFGNNIRGTHYAGVFFADGSDGNVLFDNSIFGATAWAMESVHPAANTTFNNLTNLKLRNISAGLDPNLLRLGGGQFDPPHPK